jgi:alanyl-tRNA synthetase
VHHAEVEGTLRVGDRLALAVDAARRDAIRRNHSATHLLQLALRTVLGEHVAQKGSLVTPERLRFDFAHFQPLTPDERARVEQLVNDRILRNVSATTEVLPIAEAKQAGAIAFFGEKYGDTVRMLTIGDSKELCGGTHVGRSGDIGLCKITEESGVAQGVRRLEAVTGTAALLHVQHLERELLSVGERFRIGPFEVAARVEKLQADLRERGVEIDRLKAKLAGGGGQDLAAQAVRVGGRALLVADVGVGDPKILRETIDRLRDKLAPAVVVLAGAEGDKLSVICAVTKDAGAELHAGKIVGELSQSIGGKGGGRPDLGQGGGAKPADVAAVLAGWREKLTGLLARG